MKICVISVQNCLLSGAIVRYMSERGEMQAVRITGYRKGEPFETCRSLDADVLLMEAAHSNGFTLDERMETIRQIRQQLPKCKIALLCDENADRSLAGQVRQKKKEGLIDGFFYASVSGDYLIDALDAL